jgi:hypothetical protein
LREIERVAQGICRSGSLRYGRKIENREGNHSALDALLDAEVTDRRLAGLRRYVTVHTAF